MPGLPIWGIRLRFYTEVSIEKLVDKGLVGCGSSVWVLLKQCFSKKTGRDRRYRLKPVFQQSRPVAGVFRIRRKPNNKLEDNDAEGPEIDAVGIGARPDFGGHVALGAAECPQRGGSRRGDTKVGQLCMDWTALRKENVFRLEISMGDMIAM